MLFLYFKHVQLHQVSSSVCGAFERRQSGVVFVFDCMRKKCELGQFCKWHSCILNMCIHFLWTALRVIVLTQNNGEQGFPRVII